MTALRTPRHLFKNFRVLHSTEMLTDKNYNLTYQEKKLLIFSALHTGDEHQKEILLNSIAENKSVEYYSNINLYSS